MLMGYVYIIIHICTPLYSQQDYEHLPETTLQRILPSRNMFRREIPELNGLFFHHFPEVNGCQNHFPEVFGMVY